MIVNRPNCAELHCAEADSAGPDCAWPDRTCTAETAPALDTSNVNKYVGRTVCGMKIVGQNIQYYFASAI